jgi:hypothetical protein
LIFSWPCGMSWPCLLLFDLDWIDLLCASRIYKWAYSPTYQILFVLWLVGVYLQSIFMSVFLFSKTIGIGRIHFGIIPIFGNYVNFTLGCRFFFSQQISLENPLGYKSTPLWIFTKTRSGLLILIEVFQETQSLETIITFPCGHFPSSQSVLSWKVCHLFFICQHPLIFIKRISKFFSFPKVTLWHYLPNPSLPNHFE